MITELHIEYTVDFRFNDGTDVCEDVTFAESYDGNKWEYRLLTIERDGVFLSFRNAAPEYGSGFVSDHRAYGEWDIAKTLVNNEGMPSWLAIPDEDEDEEGFWW